MLLVLKVEMGTAAVKNVNFLAMLISKKQVDPGCIYMCQWQVCKGKHLIFPRSLLKGPWV